MGPQLPGFLRLLAPRRERRSNRHGHHCVAHGRGEQFGGVIQAAFRAGVDLGGAVHRGIVLLLCALLVRERRRPFLLFLKGDRPDPPPLLHLRHPPLLRARAKPSLPLSALRWVARDLTTLAAIAGTRTRGKRRRSPTARTLRSSSTALRRRTTSTGRRCRVG